MAGLTAWNGDGGSAGGAIRVMTGAHLVAVGVILDGNEAFTGGGGLYVAPGADARVVRSAITGNAATGAFGGGVWNQGTLDLEDSLVAGNRSNRAGGIRNEGELRLRNVTVDGNEATSPEAGVGGISQNGFAFLSNVTVTRNLGRGANPAPFRGGGIQTTAGELTVLKNSVVAQNDGRGGPDDCDGPITSDSRYDLVQAPGAACILPASTATWLIGVDPQLGALAQNGGPTATRLPAPTSPLVDAGFLLTPGGPAADACEAADQRGVQRLRCDIGAVEREVPVPATITVDRTTDVADAVPGNGAPASPSAAAARCARPCRRRTGFPGLQTIVVPAGVYVLASAPAGEGGANPDAAGDLDLLEDVTIVGAGAATTRVDANALSRAFDAAPGVDIELTGLTLGNGRDAGGGALRLTSARAVLRGVALLRNVSTSGGGGAIQGGGLDERVEVLDSTLSENRAGGLRRLGRRDRVRRHGDRARQHARVEHGDRLRRRDQRHRRRARADDLARPRQRRDGHGRARTAAASARARPSCATRPSTATTRRRTEAASTRAPARSRTRPSPGTRPTTAAAASRRAARPRCATSR